MSACGSLLLTKALLTHEDFVESQALNPGIPGIGTQEIEENLARVSERGQVLAVNEHQVFADTARFGDEHEFSGPELACIVVARGQDVFLLDAEGLAFEGRVFVLKNLSVEAVIILGR